MPRDAAGIRQRAGVAKLADAGHLANANRCFLHENYGDPNLLERTFGESRRRVKVIGRVPGEHSCLSLVWAVLDRASVGWRGIDTSVAGIRQLQDLRRQLLGPPTLR